jgi:hypothetical protein
MIFVVFNYPIFALLVWNHNDTRTTEHANAIRVYNFFTNPANAMNNITFLFGYVRNLKIPFYQETFLTAVETEFNQIAHILIKLHILTQIFALSSAFFGQFGNRRN